MKRNPHNRVTASGSLFQIFPTLFRFRRQASGIRYQILRRRFIVALMFIVMSICLFNLTGCTNKVCPAYKDTANRR